MRKEHENDGDAGRGQKRHEKVPIKRAGNQEDHTGDECECAHNALHRPKLPHKHLLQRGPLEVLCTALCPAPVSVSDKRVLIECKIPQVVDEEVGYYRIIIAHQRPYDNELLHFSHRRVRIPAEDPDTVRNQ